MRRDDLEAAIAWNALRAMQEASARLPTLSDDEDVLVEVTISVASQTWPGMTASGRSKPRRIGSAVCIYTAPEGQNRTESDGRGHG